MFVAQRAPCRSVVGSTRRARMLALVVLLSSLGKYGSSPGTPSRAKDDGKEPIVHSGHDHVHEHEVPSESDKVQDATGGTQPTLQPPPTSGPALPSSPLMPPFPSLPPSSPTPGGEEQTGRRGWVRSEGDAPCVGIERAARLLRLL